MTETSLVSPPAATRWTCPFCLMLCDTLSVRTNTAGDAFELASGCCAAAQRGLSQFQPTPSSASPQIDGTDCDLAAAVAAAARVLAASCQPLFGGLGTDVAGARALYRLACATGAICDPAGGAALMHSVRALQDRGSFTTTLAEVRGRADVIVCVGGLPSSEASNFFARCGLGEGLVAKHHVVVLGGSPDDQVGLATLGRHAGVTTESVPLHGDVFATVAVLAALIAQRAVRDAPPLLMDLAQRLRAASYAVIVGETRCLPEHGALVIETLNRIVGTLNETTRAGAMWLGGGNGAGTVNQVFTWLSGLPLRSRAGPLGLEHEPVCFDAARLLSDAAIDSVLWVSSFDGSGALLPCAESFDGSTALLPRPLGERAGVRGFSEQRGASHTLTSALSQRERESSRETLTSASNLPLIVLGHPALASAAARPGAVFIPVSTPGIGSPGHLFRADGGAVLPLTPLYTDTLPTLAEVLDRITSTVRSIRTGATA